MTGLRRRGIPLADFRLLRGAARRTAALRLALAVGVAGLAAAAVVLARDLQPRPSTYFAGGNGVVVVDLSTSVDPVKYRRLDRVLRTLAETNQRTGLVVYSDSAYAMLPLGSPGEELRPLLRFFEQPRRPTRARLQQGFGFPESPWAGTFRGGTRISTGLVVARQLLERDAGGSGSVVLVSDLDDSLFDVSPLTQELVRYQRAGIDLRIVPLFPNPQDRELFGRLAGHDAFVRNNELLANSRLEERRTLVGAFPAALTAALAALLLLVALNEQACRRLAWSPEAPA